MLRKNNPPLIPAKLPAQMIPHPQLLFEPQRHSLQKRADASRSVGEVCLQYPFKLEPRLVVESHHGKIIDRYSSLGEAEFHGVLRIIRIVFFPGEAFFLR